MPGTIVTLLVAATLGQSSLGQVGPGQPGAGPGPGSTPYGGGAVMTAPDSTQAFGTGDPTYPYDFEPNWAHGYYQEIPAYGGFHFFRPYNYKHVMPQSQVSAAWGNSPNMPYSHQYFDRVNGVPTVSAERPARTKHAGQDLRQQMAQVERRGRVRVTRRQGPPALVHAAPQPVTQAGHAE